MTQFKKRKEKKGCNTIAISCHCGEPVATKIGRGKKITQEHICFRRRAEVESNRYSCHTFSTAKNDTLAVWQRREQFSILTRDGVKFMPLRIKESHKTNKLM